MLWRALAPLWLTGALASAGCDGGGGTESVGTGTIIVQNRTEYPIVDLRIFSCDADNAGPNRLISIGYIEASAERAFPVSAGCWRVTTTLSVVALPTNRHEIRVRDGQTVTVATVLVG